MHTTLFSNLLTDTQLLDCCTIAVYILLLQIVQKVSSVTNHLQQTTSGVMVVLMRLQMCSQIVDSLCQNGDLYFRRTGIGLVGTVCSNNFSLLFFADHN